MFAGVDDDTSEKEIDLAGEFTFDEEDMGSCEAISYGYDEPSTSAEDKEIMDELFQQDLKKFFPAELPEEPKEKEEQNETVVEVAAVEEKEEEVKVEPLEEVEQVEDEEETETIKEEL